MILSLVTALTLAVHYGWLVEPIFGHVHWIHAVHGRFCYIPIVIAAAWFGLRGGLITAGSISFLLMPYVLGGGGDTHDIAGELGEIIFYFAIAVLTGVLVEREFTARRKQQEAQSQVEHSQKLFLVGQLAASVAHEIKNPLASIKGAADILTDDETEREEREEFKEILRNEVKRIDSTVGEFLEFARPKEYQMRNFDLTETLQATVRQIEAHARRQGVSIEHNLENSIIVNGDPAKLHQMALNLILNAIQASSDSSSISVTLNNSGPDTVLMIFSDTGVGINQSDIKNIFEPFFTSKSAGTGLGLAIVKGIVDSHNGNISVESEEGRGTSVVVELPRVRSEN